MNIKMVMGGSWYGTGEVVALSGVPKDTLITWDRRGVLQPHHIPHGKTTRRRYTLKDIFAACICKTLSKYGFGNDTLRKVAELVKTKSDEELEHARIVMTLDPVDEKDGQSEVERTFYLTLTDKDYLDMIDCGASFQLSLKDFVANLRQKMREIGMEPDPPRQAELAMH